MSGTGGPQTEARRGAGRRGRKLAIFFGLVAAVLLAFFLPPLVNLGKYKRSITASMSTALGRPVYVGSMSLRLLPMPGIAMSNVTVEEDPAFGYEPVLHADSLVASVRLTSLWRGELEVSRISLDGASLNLERLPDGQWNIGSVLLRASHAKNAPTAQRRPGANPRFPYIEASDSRINFKEGLTKGPFSLSNAEFSMWQAGGGEWQLRLKAQPLRTDRVLHLSDVGEVHVDGALGKASTLNAMPVNLRAEWSGAQLGQVSRLLFGFDSGWRGDLDATATIGGDLGNLALRSRVRIGNLRRQEFQPANTMDVDATCQSHYQHNERLLSGIECFWPVGGGHLLLTGQVQGFAAPQSDLQLELNRIPARFAMSLLGLMQPGAQNATAAGIVNGSFELATGKKTAFSGDATATGVTIGLPGSNLDLPPLHFATSGPVKTHRSRKSAGPQPADAMAVDVEPFDLPFGEKEPLTVSAHLDGAGFEVHVTGDASVDQLLKTGSSLGFLGNSLSSASGKGSAELNTTTAGSWIAPLGAASGMGTTGTIRVTDAELTPGFLRMPVRVKSAEIDLTPQQIAWQNAELRFAGMEMRGSMQYPTACDQQSCPATFTLQPGTLNGARIEAALEGKRPGFFGRILADTLGSGTPAPWPLMQGRVEAAGMKLGHLTLRDPVAKVSVQGQTLTIQSLDAAALGGALHASGTMAVNGGNPQWKLEARLTGAKAKDVAALFGEKWGEGAVNGSAKLTLSGVHAADLEGSASGTFHFAWLHGRIAGVRETPLARFSRWSGDGTIANSTLTLTSSSLASAGRSMPVTGTVGFDRRLALTLQTHTGAMQVGGTAAHPSVSSPAATHPVASRTAAHRTAH
jgi:hypothetical protein